MWGRLGKRMKKISRKAAIVGGTALLVGGVATAAYAATVGITVFGGETYASGTTSPCQTSALLASIGGQGAYDATAKAYTSNAGVVVSNIDHACAGKYVTYTLYNKDGQPVNYLGNNQNVGQVYCSAQFPTEPCFYQTEVAPDVAAVGIAVKITG